LNAAIEAAHSAEPAAGPTPHARQVRDSSEHTSGRPSEGGRDLMAAPCQADTFPPIEAPGGATPQTTGNGNASAADSGVQARRRQESLERLRQSLGVACDVARPADGDGGPQTEKVRPQPPAAPEPVPATRRRRQPQCSPFSPRDSFERGP
jgi:hypothetical protein